MTKVSGGRVVAEALAAEGVETIFGIVDGTYLQLFASCVDLGMRMVTPRHESIAAHMAGAYARTTGKLGVFIASNGPGVANVLPGVAVEQGEGNRVLLITSCRRPEIAYPDRGGAYQTFDQVGVISAMSKWSQTVKSPARLPELLRAALRACWTGRPGVVHLDIPETVVNGTMPRPEALAPHRYRATAPRPAPEAVVDQAARLLSGAKLPVIHCGSGVLWARAHGAVEELASLLGAPVLTSWGGRGAIPETSPYAFPMIHVPVCDSVRNAGDVLLCLGSDLGETDWWGKAPNWPPPDKQKLIQVDSDESVIGRNRAVEVAAVADVGAFLAQLLPKLRAIYEKNDGVPASARRDASTELAAKRDAARRKLDEALVDRASPMLTAHVATSCREIFDDDAIAVFDGGNTAVWGSFYTEIREPGAVLMTNHFGHLGAGIGQALGAKVAHPDRQVYCIIGDGAMGFHPQEIETAVRNDLPVVFLVCCDRQWGMVKLTQRLGLAPKKTIAKKVLGPVGTALAAEDDGAREGLAGRALGPIKAAIAERLAGEDAINGDLGEIRYDLLAEAMGAYGERVSDPDKLVGAIERALRSGRPAVIHVDVDGEKHLWAPGLQHFKTMHQEPKGK